MTTEQFARLLGPAAVAVFIVGWVLAVASFFVIGTETCAETSVPLAGDLTVCQDTTSSAVILVTAIGFAATVGSMFLLALRYVIVVLRDIEANTRRS